MSVWLWILICILASMDLLQWLWLRDLERQLERLRQDFLRHGELHFPPPRDTNHLLE